MRLERVATVPLSYAGEGRIRMETSTTLFGNKVVAQITGSPRWSVEQTITLADPTIKVADVNLPDFAATALLGRSSNRSPEGPAAGTGSDVGRSGSRRATHRCGCRRRAVAGLRSAQVGVQTHLLQPYGPRHCRSPASCRPSPTRRRRETQRRPRQQRSSKNPAKAVRSNVSMEAFRSLEPCPRCCA